jgi:phage tail-like protein
MDTGSFFLNVADQWPSFDLHDLAIAPDGSLGLVATAQGYATHGTALAGPFQAADLTNQWFRVRVFAEPQPPGTTYQIYTYTDDAAAPPFDPAGEVPFAGPSWRAVPRGLDEALILNPPARLLWIGVSLRGPGSASPAIRQMMVSYGRDTYLPYLPPLYSSRPEARDFLERLLALFQGIIGGVEGEIDDLPLLFDPYAAQDPPWLDWLYGWLAFLRAARWTEEESRRYLAQAFELYGSRGTIAGLRRYLKIYTGVDARIEEPARWASLWSLGAVSTLGFTTMLAPVPMGGAVVGTTAVLDGSRISSQPDGGEFFEDVAHRFCVEVYCSQLSYPGAIENVRAVIDREKPAHTVYTLCAIDAQMRVGWQARVGIDSIIAAGPLEAQLGAPIDGRRLGERADECEGEDP